MAGSEAGCERGVTATALGPSDVFTMAEDHPLHERSSLQAEHRSAVLAGLAAAAPLSGVNSTLLVAHTKSACHYHGFLPIDPTVQVDLCINLPTLRELF